MLRDVKTIPTIHNINYLFDILEALHMSKCTFEEIRKVVKNSRRDIELDRVAFSLSEKYLSEKEKQASYMWNQSAKNLRELMILGLVKEKRLKYSITITERENVELYKREKFELTEDGMSIAGLVENNFDKVVDTVLEKMYFTHRKLRDFIQVMKQNEFILFPEISTELVKNATKNPKEYINFISNIAGEIINTDVKVLNKHSVKDVISYLEGYISSRLRSNRIVTGQVAGIALKSVNRGIKNVMFDELGMKIDIPSFEVMLNWCKQFRICNYARNIPNMNGLIVYMTASITSNEELDIKHRNKELVLNQVLEEIPRLFFKFKTTGSPWASVYPIRSAICFNNRIDDETFDEIITDIVNRDINVNYKLALETDVWASPPRSTRPLMINRKERKDIISIYDLKGGF